MHAKSFRQWAYHSEYITVGTTFAVLPEVANVHTLRRLRRRKRKEEQRNTRKVKRIGAK